MYARFRITLIPARICFAAESHSVDPGKQSLRSELDPFYLLVVRNRSVTDGT
jgi:hypothetical protein